jgi:RimJ/RimL family protein N-acetyltransferase
MSSLSPQPDDQTSEERPQPALRKPISVQGQSLVFRNATVQDAAFILALRTDQKKGAHLSRTANDLKLQETWLEKYQNDPQQVYFVIYNQAHERVGTVRLYDPRGLSFCWGSWILKDGSPSHYALESALLVYHFALHLGFKKAHFDVRQANQSVWKFHERFGAVKVGESTEDFFYEISTEAIQRSLEKYRRFLPNGWQLQA